MPNATEVLLIPEPDTEQEHLELEGLPGHEAESEFTKLNLFLWILTLSAGISGLLFGYDTGVISAMLIRIGSDLSNRPLTTYDKSLIASCTSLFALLASPVSAILADKVGRKTIILLADVLFMGGALWQGRTSSLWGMIAGRSIIGIAVGAASLIVPLYISELSPSPVRGRLVTISCLAITLGQVIAYVTGFLLSKQAGGWRWMAGLGALPAGIQFLTLAFLPESPRWLVKRNKTVEARRVLYKVFGNEQENGNLADEVLHSIERESRKEEVLKARRLKSNLGDQSFLFAGLSGALDSWKETFGVGGNRRALTIACLLQGLQQLCGFNSLMYFSATIFQLVGFNSPTLTSLSIAVTNFLFTLVAFASIDRIGRRKILLYSIPVMIAGLALSAIAFYHISLPDVSPGSSATSSQEPWVWIVLIALVIYVSGYAVGIGNVPWQQSELFPLSIRSIGSGIATATNWGSNFIIGLTFLPMMEVLTPAGTFTFYSLVCLAGWVLVRRIYPETKGLSLEDVGGLLKDGWGVEESLTRTSNREYT